jgi:hypothetical protein
VSDDRFPAGDLAPAAAVGAATLFHVTRVEVYSDEKVANRDIRVWRGVRENGP